MASKDDFTSQQWTTLRQAPFLVGYFIAKAEDSGILGSTKEMLVAGRILTGTDAAPALVKALCADVGDPGALRELFPEETRKRLVGSLLRTQTLSTCRQAVEIVDSKLRAQDALAFKEWLLSIGQRVAEASKEGGFLGFGGTRVSEAETQALRELADALGVAASSPSSE